MWQTLSGRAGPTQNMAPTMADGGSGHPVDVAGAAHHPQAPAPHTPHAPPPHAARWGGLADLQHRLGDCWTDHGSHMHPAIAPEDAGRPKLPLGIWSHANHHTHQEHAARADSHHTCRTLRLIRVQCLPDSRPICVHIAGEGPGSQIQQHLPRSQKV